MKYFWLFLLWVLVGFSLALNAESPTLNHKIQSYKSAPNIRFTTLNNKTYTLDQYLKKGPVLLNFWATWCGPCIKEMKAIKSFYPNFKEQGLQVLSVSIDDIYTTSQITRVVRRYRFPFTIIKDTDQSLFKKMGGQNIPYSFIIDQQGKIRYQHTGYSPGDDKQLIKILTSLFQQTSSSNITATPNIKIPNK
ncbi:hypothetical protein DID75_04475 [Candidatus Marinamargulisbacteria bacterium SCGC AG-410-N11]|nr:hypothetical protein DID75_04475 [Candidatus Marinamargulisbacteria bacterium SCGC AG-410-N11]